MKKLLILMMICGFIPSAFAKEQRTNVTVDVFNYMSTITSGDAADIIKAIYNQPANPNPHLGRLPRVLFQYDENRKCWYEMARFAYEILEKDPEKIKAFFRKRGHVVQPAFPARKIEFNTDDVTMVTRLPQNSNTEVLWGGEVDGLINGADLVVMYWIASMQKVWTNTRRVALIPNSYYISENAGNSTGIEANSGWLDGNGSYAVGAGATGYRGQGRGWRGAKIGWYSYDGYPEKLTNKKIKNDESIKPNLIFFNRHGHNLQTATGIKNNTEIIASQWKKGQPIEFTIYGMPGEDYANLEEIAVGIMSEIAQALVNARVDVTPDEVWDAIEYDRQVRPAMNGQIMLLKRTGAIGALVAHLK
ncbi:hypothetical protein KAR28_03095 [Candidatus Parcubacteria bacterium]|nr:hypothetical protein [Candidatus Parcubacteria bacterium]